MKHRKEDVDHGYAWVVLAACFSIEFLYGLVICSVGVLTPAFLEEIDNDLVKVSWIGSTLLGTFTMCGPFVGSIEGRLGHRLTGMMGGILMLVGLTSASFCRTVTGLILTFGVLTGLGCGMAANVSGVAPGDYFNKRLPVAYGICMSGGALGLLAVGPLTIFLLELYNLPGTLIILGAIGFHVCLAGALLRPSSTLMQEITVSEDAPEGPADSVYAPQRSAECVDTPQRPAESVDVPQRPAESVDVPQRSAESGDVPQRSAERVDTPQRPAESVNAQQRPAESVDVPQRPAESEDVPQRPTECVDAPQRPAEWRNETQSSTECVDGQKGPTGCVDVQEGHADFVNEQEGVEDLCETIVSHQDEDDGHTCSQTDDTNAYSRDSGFSKDDNTGTVDAVVVPLLEQKSPSPKTQTRCRKIRENVAQYGANGFFLFLLSSFFWSLSEATCMVHLPNYAELKGSTPAQSASLFTGMGVTALFGGLLSGLASSDKAIGSVLLHVGFEGMTGVSIMLLPVLSHTYLLQMVACVFYGLYSQGPYTLVSPICIELLGRSKLAVAYGMWSFVFGIGLLCGPPLASLIYENSRDYDYTFILAGCCNLTSAIVAMCIPLCKKAV